MTPEIKEKIFSRYWGQKMGYYESSILPNPQLISKTINKGNLSLLQFNDRYKLILRELSEITDMEAIEIARLMADIRNSDRKFEIKKNYGSITLEPLYPELESVGRKIQKQLLYIGFGGEIFDAVSGHPICNQHLISQYLFEKGFSMPIWELGGKTPFEAGIAMKLKTEETKSDTDEKNIQ